MPSVPEHAFTATDVRAESGPFDLGELSRRVEIRRKAQGLTLTALSREVGVAASTIRRFQSADDAEADGVLALIGWLGDSPESFISDSSVTGALLPAADTGWIRVDMDLIAKLSSQPLSSPSRTSTRTTIQRLAGTAQASMRTIASLTRWSEC